MWVVLLASAVPAVPRGAQAQTATATDGGVSLTTLVRRYNAEERRLLALSAEDAGRTSAVPIPVALAHWKKLGALRVRIERLDHRRGFAQLGSSERILLRHELAELLGHPLDLADVKGGLSDAVREADVQRKEDLVAIARAVNHGLDFSIHEVLGMIVDAAAGSGE
jgi:hypothetical protein